MRSHISSKLYCRESRLSSSIWQLSPKFLYFLQSSPPYFVVFLTVFLFFPSDGLLAGSGIRACRFHEFHRIVSNPPASKAREAGFAEQSRKKMSVHQRKLWYNKDSYSSRSASTSAVFPAATSDFCLMTLAGTPATTLPAGTSLTTTAPAATTEP